MPETNEKGEVALWYLQPIQKFVELGNGHQYVFVVRRNVSLAWVLPEDVERCFSIKTGCCGHTINPAFRYASDSEVRIWSGTADR
jgi:hypothetical protein